MLRISTLVFLAISVSTVQGESGFGPGEQDYGYVTVRPGAHMFWWLHHANVSESSTRPLIIWLFGGPGMSSCGEGNFQTVGPFDTKLQPREHAWTKNYNVLFIDSPVGSGYSYVEDLSLLSDNNKDIAKDMLVTLKSFFERLPKFKTTPTYLYGFSYGGKLVADLAMEINQEVEIGTLECDLKGVAVADAWISPLDISLHYSSFLYEFSLVDRISERAISHQYEIVQQTFNEGRYEDSTIEWLTLLELIQNVTGGLNPSNVIDKHTRNQSTLCDPKPRRARNRSTTLEQYDYNELNQLMNGPVKEALKIPTEVVWGSQGLDTNFALWVDFMKPVTKAVEHLLNNTNVQVYVVNGNLDLTCNTPGAMEWVQKLKWKNENAFASASRTTTWLNNTMEGYEKKGGGLNFYWINVAGHDAISDNPAATTAFLKSMTGV